MQTNLLKLREVCERLRISYSTGMRLVNNGELRSFRVRAAWRVWEKDLEAYVLRQASGVRPASGGEEEQRG